MTKTYILETKPSRLRAMAQEIINQPREKYVLASEEESPPTYIYVLWDKDNVVYVGQSINVQGRISQHRTSKEWDSYSFYEVDELTKDDIEMYLIVSLKPKYNQTGKDAELLVRLDDKL